MHIEIGDRVIYTPITMRRGLYPEPKKATVLGTYVDTAEVRIICDKEKLQRKVKIAHLKDIDGI